jgi:putative glycosyltransferase (TIGR04372 family)
MDREFLDRQIRAIRKHGLAVVWYKLSVRLRPVKNLVFSLPFFPFALLVRIIKPFKQVRFGRIINQRLGHYAANTELYLCGYDAGIQPQNTFDIFCHDDTFYCNKQLRKMWIRVNRFRVWDWARYIKQASTYLPGAEDHVIPTTDRDIHGLYARIPPHVSFTPEEEEMGRQALRKMGIPDGAQFICIHSRDSAYLEETFPYDVWDYHSYRDSSIDDFIPAAEEMARRGYYVVRMGARVKDPMRTGNRGIIDYANGHRSDFMDIYLAAKCYFYLGDSCGINAVSFIFRRPVATTNFLPMGLVFTWGPNNITIFKKLRSLDEGRMMSFREVLESGADSFDKTSQYASARIEIENNTAEDILKLAVEMDERLKGTWQTDTEDEKLQERLWSIYRKFKTDSPPSITARIGLDFLKSNREFLE